MDANLRSELQSQCSASIKQVAKVNRKIADKTIQFKNLEEKYSLYMRTVSRKYTIQTVLNVALIIGNQKFKTIQTKHAHTVCVCILL